jgi:uncharacterized surface protein with fasciclin (FAS1) repeats
MVLKQAVLIFFAVCQSWVNVTLLNQTIANYERSSHSSARFMTGLLLQNIASLALPQLNHSIFLSLDDGVATLPWTLQAQQELNFLKYHIVPKKIAQDSIATYYTSLSGADIKVKRVGTRSVITSGNRSNSTILTSISIDSIDIYILDNVLDPPSSLNSFLQGQSSTLWDQVLARVAPLEWPSDAFTVFLPTSVALQSFVRETCGNVSDFRADVLKEIVQHHILPVKVYAEGTPNQNVTAISERPLRVDASLNSLILSTRWSEARVVDADLILDKGPVHYIDSVMIPRNTIFCIERITVTSELPCPSSSVHVSTTVNPITVTRTVTEIRNATCTISSTTTMTVLTARP